MTPNNRTSFLLISCLLALSACNPAPKYARPPAPTPVAYKEGAGWKLAQPSDDKIRAKWWEIYNDRELSSLAVSYTHLTLPTILRV